MKRNLILGCALLVASVLLWPAGWVEAGSQDDAVVAVHAKAWTLKTGDRCALFAPTIPCSQYVTNWPLSTSAFVYLVVAKADPDSGISGVSLGIDYDPDLYLGGWTGCADLEFTNSGPNGEWPAAGGGNTLTWEYPDNCQGTVYGSDGAHVIIGSVYVYAYDNAVLSVTDNNNLLIDQELRVSDCNLTESILAPTAKGSVGFGAQGGLNPCTACSPCVVIAASDSSICIGSLLSVPVTVVNCSVEPADITVTDSEGLLSESFFSVPAGDTVTTQIDVDCTSAAVLVDLITADISLVSDSTCTSSDEVTVTLTCQDPCVALAMTGDDVDVGTPASVEVTLTNCGSEATNMVANCTVAGVPESPRVFNNVPPAGNEIFSVPFLCDPIGPITVVCTVQSSIATDSTCVDVETDSVTVLCRTIGPQISSILDVGHDQGRQVRITFQRSPRDTLGSPTPVTQYEAYRRIDPLPSAVAKQPQRAKLLPQSGGPGVLLAGWDYVGAIPAHTELEYSVVVPTLADSSVANGMHWSVFLLRAATSTPGIFYDSLPDSGYSMDNLAPLAPESVNLDSNALLSWKESMDPDFSHFSVYGSDQDALGPGAELLEATTGTGLDVSSDPFPFYLVTATDFSGNEGEARSASSVATTPAGTGVQIQLGPDTEVTFSDVAVEGETEMQLRSSGVDPPVGIQIVPASPPIYYDLVTTAVFSGLVEVCITYDPALVQGPETELVLMHYDESLNPSSWREITTSLDTGAHLICGETASLSPFVIAEAGAPTGIEGEPVRPTAYRMHPSSPNPFRSRTRVQYDLPEGGSARLQVFDLQGRPVRTLVDVSNAPAGRHQAVWDGRSDGGQRVVPGVYFYRLLSAGRSFTQRVLLLP